MIIVPDEIWALICGNLEPYDLVNVAVVNSRFRSAAQRAIFRRVEIHYERPLKAFIRAVEGNTTLGLYVKSIRIAPRVNPGPWFEDDDHSDDRSEPQEDNGPCDTNALLRQILRWTVNVTQLFLSGYHTDFAADHPIQNLNIKRLQCDEEDFLVSYFLKWLRKQSELESLTVFGGALSGDDVTSILAGDQFSFPYLRDLSLHHTAWLSALLDAKPTGTVLLSDDIDVFVSCADSMMPLFERIRRLVLETEVGEEHYSDSIVRQKTIELFRKLLSSASCVMSMSLEATYMDGDFEEDPAIYESRSPDGTIRGRGNFFFEFLVEIMDNKSVAHIDASYAVPVTPSDVPSIIACTSSDLVKRCPRFRVLESTVTSGGRGDYMDAVCLEFGESGGMSIEDGGDRQPIVVQMATEALRSEVKTIYQLTSSNGAMDRVTDSLQDMQHLVEVVDFLDKYCYEEPHDWVVELKEDLGALKFAVAQGKWVLLNDLFDSSRW